MRGTHRICHTVLRAGLVTAVVCLVALSVSPSPARADSTTIPLGSLLSSQTAGAPTIGQVERIAIGSRGATVTLENGEEVGLDFSGLAGVGGGPNYIGWGMVVFGLSVGGRLISSVGRILRPFGRRRSRHDDD